MELIRDLRWRWAACQLQVPDVKNCIEIGQLRKILNELPETLEETYQRILDLIPKINREKAAKMLQWLTLCAQPLRVEELADAVSFQPQEGPHPGTKRRVVYPELILELCSAFVTFLGDIDISETEIDQQDKAINASFSRLEEARNVGIVRLSHFTVKEYLVSEAIRRGPTPCYAVNTADGSREMAKLCLEYLLEFHKSGALPRDPSTAVEYPLLGYAAKYWYEHAANIEDGGVERETLDELVGQLMLTRREVYRLATFL